MISAIIGAIGSIGSVLLGGSQAKKMKTKQAIAQLQDQLSKNISSDISQEKKIKYLIFAVLSLAIFIVILFFRSK